MHHARVSKLFTQPIPAVYNLRELLRFRQSYSVLSVLGFMYPEMNFTCAEFTHKAYIPQYEEKHPLIKGMKHLRNSDAHYLENMVEASEEIDLPECTAKAVVDYILNKLGFKAK